MLRLVLKNRPPVGHRVGHRVGHGLGHVLSTPGIVPKSPGTPLKGRPTSRCLVGVSTLFLGVRCSVTPLMFILEKEKSAGLIHHHISKNFFSTHIQTSRKI